MSNESTSTFKPPSMYAFAIGPASIRDVKDDAEPECNQEAKDDATPEYNQTAKANVAPKHDQTAKNDAAPEYNQEAKADAGKPRLTLVPRQIIWDIARIREFGTGKYKDPDNWKRVEADRYKDAAYRHFMAYLDDPKSLDEESGLPHLWHLACNIAFLCELEKDEVKNK